MKIPVFGIIWEAEPRGILGITETAVRWLLDATFGMEVAVFDTFICPEVFDWELKLSELKELE